MKIYMYKDSSYLETYILKEFLLFLGPVTVFSQEKEKMFDWKHLVTVLW